MSKAFKSKATAEQSVEISGVGVVPAKGKGGVLVDSAAQVMAELQKRHDDGSLDLDGDGNSQPLEGKALTKAAEEFAKARDLRVVDVNDAEVAGWGDEVTGRKDETEDLRDKSIREYKETYGDLEPAQPSEEQQEAEAIAAAQETEARG